MKILKLFLIVAAFLGAGRLTAQTIDTASEWRVNFSIWEPGVSMETTYYRDFIDGDTVVNSHSYVKIYRSGYVYHDWYPYPYPSYTYFSHILHGLMRAENHRWFVYSTNNGQEDILLDFNLKAGDTVHSAFTVGSVPITVTSVDSVQIDNQTKKRFHLSTPYGAENYIEDIGAASGLFENMYFFEWNSELVCFAKNGTSLWGASTNDCELNVAIAEKRDPLGELTVYPNPASDWFQLSIPPDFKYTRITVMDPFGRIVREIPAAESRQFRIAVNTTPAGLYFVRVENERQQLTVKLLVR